MNKSKRLSSIRKDVETHFKVDISEKRRHRGIVYPRAIYYSLARTFTKHTLTEIGAPLGFKHDTVINALKGTLNDLQYDCIYKDFLAERNEMYKGQEVVQETLEQENERLKEEIRVLTMKNIALREA